MKKKLAIVLMIAMTCSLAACGNKTAQPVEPEVSVSAETSISEETSVESSIEASVSVEEPEEVDDGVLRLKSLFAKHGIKAGTCVSYDTAYDIESRLIITDQFNSITMESDMMPGLLINYNQSIEAGELVVDFHFQTLKLLDFVKKNKMALRGSTLVSSRQTPEWIFFADFEDSSTLASREVMLERMESYIKQTFEKLDELGYADSIYAYDIVDEAWNDDGSMRDNYWLKTIGDDYLYYAFYYADKYAPDNIDLYYNEYNEQIKVDTIKDFVETLKDDNGRYLIDGIGLQAHLDISDDANQYMECLDSLAELGLKIELTELDVCIGTSDDSAVDEDSLKAQGRFYYDLINGIFERVDNGTLNIDAITFSGFSDRASIYSEYSPLLYDSLLKPKYAYYGAMQVKDMAGYSE